MSIRTEFEYLTPAAYRFAPDGFTFEELDLEKDEPPRDETSRNDIGYFLSVAGRYPLLAAEEERAAGMRLWSERIRLLRVLRRSSLEPIPHSRPASPSTRRRLARVESLARALADGSVASRKGVSRKQLRKSLGALDEARTLLVERNLRLVVWVAKRFRGRGFDFIDLIQEGSLGLMRAVDRFDPRVGARFSTFATHWIQQGIRRALAEKSRCIRIPVNRIPEVRRITFERSRLSASLGRAALVEEIASACDLSRSKVEELLPAIGRIESLDGPIPTTDRLLSETLADRGQPSALEKAMEEETRRTVKRVLSELPERQRTILAMRHGIDYPRECSLEEIGHVLGLSRERIRQVEKAAAAAVRGWIETHRSELAKPV